MTLQKGFELLSRSALLSRLQVRCRSEVLACSRVSGARSLFAARKQPPPPPTPTQSDAALLPTQRRGKQGGHACRASLSIGARPTWDFKVEEQRLAGSGGPKDRRGGGGGGGGEPALNPGFAPQPKRTRSLGLESQRTCSIPTHNPIFAARGVGPLFSVSMRSCPQSTRPPTQPKTRNTAPH